MTKDDIVKLAIENTISGLKFDEDGLVRFAKLIAEQEREACAKVCDVLAYHPEFASDVTKLAAMAIRARKQA
jgi:hypothetical protein